MFFSFWWLHDMFYEKVPTNSCPIQIALTTTNYTQRKSPTYHFLGEIVLNGRYCIAAITISLWLKLWFLEDRKKITLGKLECNMIIENKNSIGMHEHLKNKRK